MTAAFYVYLFFVAFPIALAVLIVAVISALIVDERKSKKKPACWHCDFEADELEEWDD